MRLMRAIGGVIAGTAAIIWVVLLAVGVILSPKYQPWWFTFGSTILIPVAGVGLLLLLWSWIADEYRGR